MQLTAERCKKLIIQLTFERDNGGMSNQKFDYLEALEIALPVLEQQGGWISCSERIPDPLDWVIAYDEVGTVKAYVCQHTGEWIRDNGDELYQITYWQPLPAPPQSPTNNQVETIEGR
jgi:hypothetical protein